MIGAGSDHTRGPEEGTALRCLALVARHHGLAASPTALRDRLAPGDDEPSTADALRIATAMGFKASARRLDWRGLCALPPVFPVLARLTNGNSVILVGLSPPSGADAGAMVGIVDPLADRLDVIDVPRDRFLERWNGELIFLKPRRRLSDPQQPFGLRWFLPEVLRQKGAFRDVLVAALALHALALAVPVYFQIVIDKVLVHETVATLQVLTIGVLGGLLFETVFRFLRQFILLAAANRIDIRLLNRTFGHLLDLPITFFDARPAGITVRHMQQVERIREFLTGTLLSTALDSLMLLVFLPVLAVYSPKLTLLVLLFGFLITVVMMALVPLYRNRLRDLYAADADRQAMLVETIHGMRTVKSSALEALQRRQWDSRAAHAVTNHYRVGRIAIVARSLTEFLEKAMMVAVVAVGALDVFDHQMTVGALIAFQMLAGRVVTPLAQLVALVHQYQETALSVRMLGEVMNHPAESRREGAGACPPLSGRITVDGVGFRYDHHRPPALAGVTLDIAAGSVVGLVGRSGSGKSTLMRLLQGVYPPQEGAIRYDGLDIRELDLTHLRRSIGVVLQDNFLFRGSIRDNIAMTLPGAPREAVVEAARLAGADDFIRALPDGYDTLVEEGASNLSGGQKQRIAIARALLPQPRVLILDEATSALDPDSEAVVMTGLRRIAQGRTVLIVTHRLTTLTGCDTIAVLEQGHLIDQAPHPVLLARCGEYRHLWQQQNRGH
ncbi:peptidase domain-containing ABC transporter [Azospirillum griseum]|uniref:Peptidase domain-containing ABC transporter n=1 Tax=Azospirillum griseum TaxID=2496639 RepID=A0A431VAK9_9PROT|nr:peptidase domain-containing ABC transporter [Azospirillum griseum]RTR14220.1 peptidase domain-containing ABC transporter [Azospirillum griseum]